jgi:K+-transporting ATPase KdpF subunit
MGPFNAVAENLGLTTLTAIAVFLTLYLIYSMVHPERFQK